MADEDQSPELTQSSSPPAARRTSDDAEHSLVITSAALAVDAMLRQPRRLTFQLSQPGAGKLIVAMLTASVVCSAFFGVVVGSLSGGRQWWAAPLKIVVGMLASALICLPSLYILLALTGVKARLAEVVGLLVGLLMLMAVLLIGFAPVAWLFSASTESLGGMAALHLLLCLIAATFGVRFLRAGCSQLHGRSNAGANAWAVIFVPVLLQMSTVLRPILGTADTLLPAEKKFFLAHWTEDVD